MSPHLPGASHFPESRSFVCLLGMSISPPRGLSGSHEDVYKSFTNCNTPYNGTTFIPFPPNCCLFLSSNLAAHKVIPEPECVMAGHQRQPPSLRATSLSHCVACSYLSLLWLACTHKADVSFWTGSGKCVHSSFPSKRGPTSQTRSLSVKEDQRLRGKT